MYTRLLSAGLWFFAAVYAGSMLHGVVGVHELVGPLAGLMTAGLIIADPFHRHSAKAAPPLIPVAAPMRDVVSVAAGMRTQV
jgi:hypothetical protein